MTRVSLLFKATCASFTAIPGTHLPSGCSYPNELTHGMFSCTMDGSVCHVICDVGFKMDSSSPDRYIECIDNSWTDQPGSFNCVPDCLNRKGKSHPDCQGQVCSSGATLLSTSPRHDMVLCKDKTQKTCEKDFETLCPAGWNLCIPGQFNNRNHDWDYNWVEANTGRPLGVIYCGGYGGDDAARHYAIRDSNPVLNTDQQLNCDRGSSRPGCEFWAGFRYAHCNDNEMSALCCAPTRTCGDGLVQQEEDCDDGNDSNMDECLNTCTWKHPEKHGLSGCYTVDLKPA